MKQTDNIEKLIAEECDAMKAMLLAKNKAYGNSALDPVRIFSKAPIDEQIRVRLDDKLSRIMRGAAAGEDVWSNYGIVDALADLDFVVEGTRQVFGVDGAPIAEEVYRTNMAKLDGPVDSATGKKLKPPGWQPPDIAGLLKQQGWGRRG